MDLTKALSRTYESIDRHLCSLKHPVLTVLIIGLVLRILFLPLTNVDSWGWYRTGENIVSGDGFYARSGYNYGPAFGYLVSVSLMIGTQLFGVGTFSGQSDAMIPLQSLFDFTPALQTIGFLASFKFMMVVGDVLCAFLVRWMVAKLTDDQSKGDVAFALIFLSPIILVESSIHGMFDIYCGLLALISVYFAAREKYYLAGLSLGIATLMKIFPVYLFPILLAFLLKQNRGDSRAIVNGVFMAVLGVLSAFALLYYPQLLDGTFSDTWAFLFGRVDSAGGIVGKFAGHIPELAVGAIVLVAIIIYIYRRGVGKVEIHLSSMQAVAVMALMVLAVFAGLVFVNGGVENMFSDLFHTSYIVGIGMQGLALIVSFYLAHKLYYSELEDQTKLVMMVGTLAVATGFLWVPMPEYLILLLPLICVYAMVYDRRYLTPFLLISFGAAFFIIMVEGPAALFVSVAQYTDLISIDTVVDLVKAYVSGPGIGDYSLLQVTFCIIGAALQLIGTILLFVYRFRPFRLEEHRV